MGKMFPYCRVLGTSPKATGMVVRLHISVLAISAICVGNFRYLRWRFQISVLGFSDICVDNVGYMRDLYRIHLAEKGKTSEQKNKEKHLVFYE